MFEFKKIVEFMESEDISQTDLASRIGEKNIQTVNNWFIRGRIPNKKIPLVMNALGIDIKDIISNNKKSDNSLIIPYINISASAGFGFEVDNLDEFPRNDDISIQRDGLQFSKESNLMSLNVVGKSMLPTIMPDDIVIIDTAINNYRGDNLYVLNYAGNLLVKRLQFNPATNSIMVISDNPEFKSFSINLNEDQSSLIVLGSVVSTIRK